MDGSDQNPSTRTPGAWLRAALELETWINTDYVGDLVRAAMKERAARLRQLAAEGLADLPPDTPRRRTTDWVQDADLPAEETLRRFEALGPEPTEGPATD